MTYERFSCFVILLDQIPNQTTPPEVIRRHIAHLRHLDEQGQLVLCGPFTDAPSGMVIVRAASKAEAEAIAMSDPFVVEGVRTCEVRTLLLACAENQYLA